MSPRAFALLLGATLVAVVLAGHAVATRDVPITGRVAERPLFDGLLDRLDQVAMIEVRGGGESATVRKTDRGWVVSERGDYPANPAKVRDLARGLAALQLVEAKTADPERLARLELEDPAAEGAKSKLVSLKDADGTVIAAAVIGKEKYSLFGGGRGGVYARRAGENQAWLVAGTVDVPGKPLDWLDTRILDIKSGDVARVILAEGTPQPLVIQKPAKDASAFELSPLPEGRTADAEKLGRVLSLLDGLTMQDVRKLADKPFPAEAPRARFETWDGLVLTVAKVTEGEGDAAEHWVTIDASAGQPPEAPPAEAAKPLEQRVADLNGRLQGWAFKLPKWLADRLTWGLDDLLAKPEGTS